MRLLLPLGLLACQDYDLSAKEQDPVVTDTGTTVTVDTSADTAGTTDSDPVLTDTVTTPPEDTAEVATELVYLNTGDTLFSYDPATNVATRIGSFEEGGRAVTTMTDIAIDLDGHMFGGSYTALFRVNPGTAELTWVADLADEMTGLTFVSDGRLVGAGARMSFVDTSTGRLTELVPFGQYTTSGDIIGLPDGMLYWTVTGGDGLVQVDPNTGATRRVGNVGATGVYGLGYAQGQLYGFTEAGRVLTIDPATGASSSRRLDGAWWGATTNPVLW
jgi:hypothetical protein